MRGPAAATALLLGLGLAGCSFYNANPSLLQLHVRNDGRRTVTLLIPGGSGQNRLGKGAGIFWSRWPNGHAGVAVLRVVGEGKTLGCLKVPYRKGQKQAFVLVTAATPCGSAAHTAGAAHWIGVAVIAVTVLAVLLLVATRLLRRFVPAEWRVPIGWAFLWVGPAFVAAVHPSWWGARTGSDAARVSAAFGLLIAVVGAVALLQRSRVAWWILVALEVFGFAIWLEHVVKHGLGVLWALSGMLSLGTLALLVSAPMRRFVRLRGRLAPGPG